MSYLSRSAAPSSPAKQLPQGYTLIPSPPSLEAYLNLRLTTGLSPKSPFQAQKALLGSWATIHITYSPPSTSQNLTITPEVVAMSRIIGDGGWYFHIVDMAVSPTHQRKGLGDFMMNHLLEKIVEEAPEGPYVNLVAEPGAVRLYAKHGFIETARTARKSVGMERRF